MKNRTKMIKDKFSALNSCSHFRREDPHPSDSHWQRGPETARRESLGTETPKHPRSSKAWFSFNSHFKLVKPSLTHPFPSKACFLFNPSPKLMNILSVTSLLFQNMFLIQFFFEIYENCLWSILPVSKHVLYSILIQSWRKSRLNHSSWSKAYFLFNSYSKLMRIIPVASLLIKDHSSSKACFSFVSYL